jgi:hypothetical protein
VLYQLGVFLAQGDGTSAFNEVKSQLCGIAIEKARERATSLVVAISPSFTILFGALLMLARAND